MYWLLIPNFMINPPVSIFITIWMWLPIIGSATAIYTASSWNAFYLANIYLDMLLWPYYQIVHYFSVLDARDYMSTHNIYNPPDENKPRYDYWIERNYAPSMFDTNLEMTKDLIGKKWLKKAEEK